MPVTSTVSETLDGAWAAIRDDLGSEIGTYTRRVFKESGLAIFVSVTEPDGLLGFSFEVSPSAVKPLRLAQSARGFEVTVERMVDALGAAVARVSIRLTHRPFADLFGVLAADIVSRAMGTAAEPEAIRVLHSRLEHWRRFAENVGPGGLEPHEQTGLFGELVFMKTLLAKGIPGEQSVSAWHGPLRDNQDYGFGNSAVEVKASTSNTPQAVTISNERQLDSTGLDRLFLFHISLDRRKGAGKFLPDLIAEIVARLRVSGTGAEILFEDRLLEQGYLESQAGLYREHGYTERGRHLYEVSEGFPRIVESELCDGVSRVRYVVDLAAARPFTTTMEEVISTMGD